MGLGGVFGRPRPPPPPAAAAAAAPQPEEFPSELPEEPEAAAAPPRAAASRSRRRACRRPCVPHAMTRPSRSPTQADSRATSASNLCTCSRPHPSHASRASAAAPASPPPPPPPGPPDPASAAHGPSRASASAIPANVRPTPGSPGSAPAPPPAPARAMGASRSFLTPPAALCARASSLPGLPGLGEAYRTKLVVWRRPGRAFLPRGAGARPQAWARRKWPRRGCRPGRRHPLRIPGLKIVPSKVRSLRPAGRRLDFRPCRPYCT